MDALGERLIIHYERLAEGWKNAGCKATIKCRARRNSQKEAQCRQAHLADERAITLEDGTRRNTWIKLQGQHRILFWVHLIEVRLNAAYSDCRNALRRMWILTLATNLLHGLRCFQVLTQSIPRRM
jgi:hypothetical protein